MESEFRKLLVFMIAATAFAMFSHPMNPWNLLLIGLFLGSLYKVGDNDNYKTYNMFAYALILSFALSWSFLFKTPPLAIVIFTTLMLAMFSYNVLPKGVGFFAATFIISSYIVITQAIPALSSYAIMNAMWLLYAAIAVSALSCIGILIFRSNNNQGSESANVGAHKTTDPVNSAGVKTTDAAFTPDERCDQGDEEEKGANPQIMRK